MSNKEYTGLLIAFGVGVVSSFLAQLIYSKLTEPKTPTTYNTNQLTAKNLF